MWSWLFCVAAVAVFSNVTAAGAGAARLICYVENGRTDSFSECTHLVYAGDARGEKLDALLKEYRKGNPRLKIILRVSDVDKDLRTLLKSKHVQGLEIHDAHKSLNKTQVLETIESARTALSATGGGPLFLALPAHPELLAKYYDLMTLVKKVDLMMVQTHALGIVKKMTYHPSRLSGLWDMMNTDSVVDLVVGLGVPASKVVISLPATARRFTLLNETLSTPGSPTLEDEPKEIDQAELCRMMQKGRWTLERDQDLSAPYAFKDKTWMSFEDASSVDVKGKYARVRGLAGLALHGADRDADTACGPTLRASLAKVLNQQSRAPRAAVLRSLEHEILSSAVGVGARAVDALQVSPYRITQVVDSDGVIHSIREDTRTEFSCSRQGYFVHPRSCARFYRCVKFDQLSPEYTVFEFDCPAGLAFDSRYEVCVWPGSLPHSQACPGSSEIAPVPHTRFICPEHEGYYADPENCRWFFACLDHGKAPLTAYEFRCPFGLGFDAARLQCDWPWLVPACGNIARYEAEAFGYSGAALTGAAGFHGQTADAVNIAGHQSLVSGASLDNLVGIQSGFLNQGDALDSNFIASQELANSYSSGDQGLNAYEVGVPSQNNVGLVQATRYNDGGKYTSGSLILDDYRLPTKEEAAAAAAKHGHGIGQQITGQYAYSSQTGQNSHHNYDSDNSGAYVHDPTGDHAVPYDHIGSPVVPYIHDTSAYKQSSDYYDFGRYSQGYEGQYQDNSGSYIDTGYKGDSGSYNGDYSGSYRHDDSGKYVAGVYRNDGHIGSYNGGNGNNQQYYGTYSSGNAANYISDSKAYTGSSHTLTAGAVNVGLVGKTTLVDSGYTDQGNYKGYTQSYAHAPIVSQPAVLINHVGTDGNNFDGYGYVTTPTSSGVPTTATPFAVTTAIPVTTYKTTFVPEAPKTSIKQIFGYTQPAVTFVQPTVVAVKEYTPQVQVTDYNQGVNYQNYNAQGQSGYEYSKPTIKFEDGISYTTQAPVVVSTFKPQGFAHSQETFHKVSGYEYSTPSPVTEEPFRKAVAYTTGSPVSYTPQAFSHQTIHKESSYSPSVEGYEYKSTSNYQQPNIQYTTAQPAVSTYQPQVFSQQTFHQVDASQVKTYSEADSGYNYERPASGYNYPKPEVKFEESPVIYSTPAPVVSTYKPQSYSHQTFHKVESKEYLPPSTVAPKVDLAYLPAVSVYENPFLKYTEKATPVTYVQPTPQSYSQQTIHKETSNVYLPSINTGSYHYEAPKTVYTTARPTVQPHVFSHQTLHKVEADKVNTYSQEGGYQYEQPAIRFEEAPKTVFQYSTPAPAVSTYKPQAYSHQTLHKVEANNDNTYSQDSGYKYEQPTITFQEYSTPAPVVTSTYKPQAYSHQTLHKVEANNVNTYSQAESGYKYEQPAIKFQEYSTPAPVVSTYKPQAYSHQTLHKIEANNGNTYSQDSGYNYQQPAIKFQEYSTPAPAVVSTYTPQSYSHQTLHKVEASNVNTYSEGDSGYNYEQPAIKFQEYSTPAPVVSTYKPQSYSHQTLHKVEASNVNTYSQAESGYNYEQPTIKFEEAPKTVVQYSTPAPVVSTYKPQSYSHQTLHQVQSVSSTPIAKVEYQQPAVTLYENPILKYTQPIVQQHEVSHIVSQPQYETSQQNLELSQGYTYSQPEIQRDVETLNTGNGYSDATLVSHQVYHQASNQYDSGKDAVFVSTTPATLAYEEHYSEYESPKIQTYKAPEYIPPKTDYQQSYSVSTAAPVVHHSSIAHETQEYDYKPIEYSQQYDTVPVQQISFSTSHVEQPKRIESVHVSSFPGTKVTTKYNQVSFESPEIQTGYRAEEYLPPVASTEAPVVTSTYTPRYSTVATTREYLPPQPEYNAPEYLPPQPEYKAPATYKPRTYSTVSTTREYLPPTTPPEYNAPEYLPPQPEYKSRDYLPPKVENAYLPPSTTARPIVKSTTQTPTYLPPSTTFKAPEYLPPQEDEQSIVNFESYGFKNADESSKIQYNPYQEYTVSTSAPARKQNIVIQTAKSNLLGFGTVGPDAGLVSPVSYTTGAPISSTYLPAVEVSSQAPIRRTRPKYKSTTQSYVESTTAYQAPEYLPPSEEIRINDNYDNFGQRNAQIRYNPYQEETVVSTSAPIHRKQNIVVETAKSQLLSFGSVGNGAGLVSSGTYTTSAPIVSSESYSTPRTVTSTYLPVKQELVEVSPQPVRRTKPKVAVVTKINDFNPLLVRKLGAVCSCQSPVLVLKGRRPNVQIQQDYDDYSNDYEDGGRGDINDSQYAQKSARLQSARVTSTPQVTSTFNPIIVPDDSFYQDYEPNDYLSTKTKEVYSENFVSSTPVVSTTEKIVRIRPRVKAVTVAPTYKTVLLNQEVAPTAAIVVKDSQDSNIDSQSFDRYGPGGWRSRDETLQGSVDCQRAGLFRHPKQCNKFYACRWDCTKQRFTLHVFNCPVQLSFDPSIGACNWPSQGPACQGDTLLTNAL